MDQLEELFWETISEIANELKSEDELGALAGEISSAVEEMVARMPEVLLPSIKRQSAEGLAERREIHEQFVTRNVLRWEKGLDALELQLGIAMEAGQAFNSRLRPQAAKDGDLLFDVLIKLHAKGCLVSQEILCLLKNGFPDGAYARWRALHELSVVARFIAAKGQDAAERYLNHDLVECYKGAKEHRRVQSRINAEGISDQEFEELREQYEAVIERYGKDFKKPYGWSSDFLGVIPPNFRNIEESVELDQWRPYYKMASQGIHASVQSLRSLLGMSESNEEVLLVGPSNSGMVDPAHATAISMLSLTTVLLTKYVNIDGLVVAKILGSLTEEVGESFMECNKSCE